MIALLLPLALAAPIFTEIGTETYLDTGGNWPRAFAADGGWHLLHADQGDYQYSFLRDDLTRDRALDRLLTGMTGLIDHGVARCPDGTYFHAATAGLSRENDSLYAFTYDADFNLLASATLVERATEGQFADVPVVCGDTFKGAAWFVPELNLPVRYASIDADLRITGTHDFYESVAAIGSSLLDDDGTLRIVGLPGKNGLTIMFDSYDASYNHLALEDIEFLPDGWEPYWAQGTLMVGDCYIVAHMAEDAAYEWNTQGGDVWIEAFDRSYHLLDQVQLSHNTAPVGGMQPGLARKDDQLLVTYAKDLQNFGWLITMDLAACGVEESPDTGDTGDTGDSGDTGPTDSGETGGDDTASDDSGESGGDDTAPDDSAVDDTGATSKDGCGCTSGAGAPGVGALLGLAALARRRRRG